MDELEGTTRGTIKMRFLLLLEGEIEGDGMDDKWVRETANRIRQEQAAKKAKDEKFVETQKLKRELGPGVWEELKVWLREACKSVNVEMGRGEVAQFTVKSGDEVSVAGKGDGMHRTMVVTWDASRGMVEYSSTSGDPAGRFEITINASGQAGLGEGNSPFGLEPAEVGKQIMKHALEVFSY